MEEDFGGKLVLRYDGEELNVDSDAYIQYVESIENLLVSQILLMRDAFPDSIENWYCGAAMIADLSKPSIFEFEFGSKDDADRIFDESNIYVEIPFD